MTKDAGPPVIPVEAVPEPPSREPLRRRIVVGGAYTFLSLVLGQVFALITSIVYARLLGPEDLGVLAIYAQLASVAVSFASLGLGTPITRFVAQLRTQDPRKLERFLATIVTITLIATVAVSATLVLLASPVGAGVYGQDRLVPMIQIAMAFLVLNSLSAVSIAILQGLQAIRLLSLVGIALEAFGIPVMFVSLSLFGLLGVAIGGVLLIVGSASLLLGSAWSRLRKDGIRIRLGFDAQSGRELARYASPLLASTVIMKFAFLYQSSLIALSLNFVAAGLFRVASTVSRLVAFVPSAISVPLLPAISEMYATRPADRMRRSVTTMFRVTAHVGAPLALAVGFAAGTIIGLLYGVDYVGATTLAFVLVVAGFVDMMSTIGANSMLGEGRTRTLLLIDGVQAGVLCGGTTVFVSQFGLMGVGYAALLNSLVYGALVLIVLGRTNRVDLPRVAAALLPAAAAFTFAAAAVVWADPRSVVWFGIAIIAAYIALAWSLMERGERKLFLSLPTEILRGGRGAP